MAPAVIAIVATCNSSRKTETLIISIATAEEYAKIAAEDAATTLAAAIAATTTPPTPTATATATAIVATLADKQKPQLYQ